MHYGYDKKKVLQWQNVNEESMIKKKKKILLWEEGSSILDYGRGFD